MSIARQLFPVCAIASLVVAVGFAAGCGSSSNGSGGSSASSSGGGTNAIFGAGD